MFGTTGKLTTATLDTSDLALQAMNEARWPILGKVHGDFRSRRLKNVSEELRMQDATLRRARRHEQHFRDPRRGDAV